MALAQAHVSLSHPERDERSFTTVSGLCSDVLNIPVNDRSRAEFSGETESVKYMSKELAHTVMEPEESSLQGGPGGPAAEDQGS